MSDGSKDVNLAVSTETTGGISRRKFLKILGSASAVGATGCADKATQKILPNVKGDPEQIPGVAVWYSSTCTECSAGCGIMVRTREGRAVKVEGNRDHPVNRGGLCALGQSSLQNLYDPDRIRQPLKRTGLSALGRSTYEPISWEEAYTTVAPLLKDNTKKKAFITGEVSGALSELLTSFNQAYTVDHIVYDVMQQTALAKASELVYGKYGIPDYKIEKADVVLNFGADFLETWINPVGYARDWADNRRRPVPGRFIHVEPRLSLTGANADLWLSAEAGYELLISLAVLKILLQNGRGKELPEAVRNSIVESTKNITVEEVSRLSGVSEEKILLTANYLKDAKTSLVIAGGASSQSETALALQTSTALINLVLGNLGGTVSLAGMRTPQSSATKLVELIEEINAGQVGAVFVYGSNPGFSFPSSYGLKYAIKKVPTVVSFASHLDETAEFADIILPSNTALESWGDQRVVPGVYSLLQPSMTPVFDTRSFADSLIEISKRAGGTDIAAGQKDFAGYIKNSWQKVYEQNKSGQAVIEGSFAEFWVKSLDRGGYFGAADKAAISTGAQTTIKPVVFEKVTGSAAKAKKELAATKHKITLYPYFSVKSFDGRAANRPWSQELPDPITQVVWDAWIEIHPDTAKEHGFSQTDMSIIRTKDGELNLPVYITDFVRPGTIAIPIGQGHTSFGRYAEKISGANVFDILPVQKKSELVENGDALNLVFSGAELKTGIGRSELVRTTGSNSQLDRELARTKVINSNQIGVAAAAIAANKHEPAGHEAHAENGHAAGHEEHKIKQMYVQREHPLYQWGLTVDLNACTGCSACVVACYAENNIPVVGKKLVGQGREMSWLRIETYWEGQGEELKVSFLPMMCQQCQNAPCEPVCPVFATYHNEEGLNAMVYNRCVGTRYCSNNCSYKVRRFNWVDTEIPAPLDWQLNPDVTKRTMGIMEKCTFCVQRIVEAKDSAKDLGRLVLDGEIQTACVQSCPTRALTFGNLNDPHAEVSKLAKNERAYKVLDHHINTQPSVSYLERVKYEL